MKKKILPFLISLTFVIIFIIFYIGLEDAKIYIPKNTAQYEISEFDTKEYYSGSKINSKEIFELFVDSLKSVNMSQISGYICSLNHGVLPKTPEENVRHFIGAIRNEFSLMD